MLAKNVLEFCDRTIRPQYKELPNSFLNSPTEANYRGVFGRDNCLEHFLVALDAYDNEELETKLVKPLKDNEFILRLYSEHVGYCGFVLIDLVKGKVRFFDGDYYDETGNYRFEKYWIKPRYIRVKSEEFAFMTLCAEGKI